MQVIRKNVGYVGLAAVRIVFGVLFMSICSQVTIPWWPVPFTMQTFSVMMLALLMQKSWVESAITGVGYIAAGALGLPVFAGASHGVEALVSPTGGYIIGFAIAMWLISFLKNKRKCGVLFSLIAGAIALFVPGIIVLSCHFGFKTAIVSGLLPFIVPECLKISLVRLLGTVGHKS